jgi:hypothetical protein
MKKMLLLSMMIITAITASAQLADTLKPSLSKIGKEPSLYKRIPRCNAKR